jgi:hypothetical protein
MRSLLAALALTLSLGLAGVTFTWSAAAAQSASVVPRTIGSCKGNYPASYARFWHSMPWPNTGSTKNKEWRVKSPDNKRWVWIWGGEIYENRSSPKLPSGVYNSYDTQFLSSANGARGPGRFVRERKNHKLYYSPSHYRDWCYVGTQYG